VTADLRSLLEAAEVPGPYLLIGQSAGGLLVQHHARAVPDDIVGVVAMNPVPLVDAAEEHMYPLITEPERTAEGEYYDGANGESIDYRASTEQIREHPVPTDVAFHMLISTIKQCGFAGDICGRGYPGYEAAMQEIAAEWPDGEYSQSEADHEIFAEDMPAVLNAVNDVLTRAGYPPAE
jgi:pimeloyl-ACP methyl ester carboxylesterase